MRYLGTFHNIQVPILNKFSTLSNYSPLPYKTVVTESSSKPHDLYHVKKYIEHLFLTNLKAPSLPSLRPLIQKSCGSFHYLNDNLVKTQDFYQLILTDSHSVTITHTKDEHDLNFIMFSKLVSRWPAVKPLVSQRRWSRLSARSVLGMR